MYETIFNRRRHKFIVCLLDNCLDYFSFRGVSMLVDWGLLVLKLRSVKSLSAISKELGIQYKHLGDLSRGDVKEPRWSTAIKLLDYYHDHFGDMEQIKL